MRGEKTEGNEKWSREEKQLNIGSEVSKTSALQPKMGCGNGEMEVHHCAGAATAGDAELDGELSLHADLGGGLSFSV